MNFLNRVLIVSIASAILCSTSWAATVIERNEFGKQQTITLDKHQVRIDSPVPNIYILMDLETEKVYMINTKEKEMIKMNLVRKSPQSPRDMRERSSRDRSQQSQPRWEQSNKSELIHKEQGPNLTGYPTVIYQVKANGKICSETYFSQPAAEVTYVEDFIKAMSKMAHSRKPKGMQLPPCLKAHDELRAKSRKLGIPMKTILKGGPQGDKMAEEITSIKADVEISADTFALPTDYKVMTEQEMIEKGQQKMRRQMEQSQQHSKRSYGMPPRQGEPSKDWQQYKGDPYNTPPPPPRDWQ